MKNLLNENSVPGYMIDMYASLTSICNAFYEISAANVYMYDIFHINKMVDPIEIEVTLLILIL